MKKIIFFIFLSLIFILSIIFSILILHYFPKKKMQIYILIISFILLFYNFMMAMILPLDIFVTYNKEEIENEEKDLYKSLKKILSSIYNMNFIVLFYINKIVITSMIGLNTSGEFSKIKIIIDAILQSVIKIITIIILMHFVVSPLLIEYNVGIVLFTAFLIYNLFSAYMYIGITMVKLPQKLYLLSDIDKSLDYYQFKTYKINVNIKENNEEMKKYLHRCKLTMEFIQKNEENEANDEVEEIKNEKLDDDSNDNANNVNNVNNDEINHNIEKDDEKKDKTNKKDKKQIKVKELIKYKNYLDLLESYIKKIFEENEIEYDENEKIDEDIIIFSDKKEIIKANEKIKEMERENEKLKNTIPDYYKKWNYYKTLQLNLKTFDENENEIHAEEHLNDEEENFIPSQTMSRTRMNFFLKYNKTYYKSLMILSIILGIIIILSENTLKVSFNISIFSFIFKKGFFSYIVYFLYVLSLIFYAMYSTKYNGMELLFGKTFKLSPKNQTDAVSFLSFVGALSDFITPICINSIKILKHGNNEDFRTIIEEISENSIGTCIFSFFQNYLSVTIIIIAVITYLENLEKTSKKKDGVQFNIDSEERNNYIKEGKNYLMKLNREYIGEFRLNIGD